MTTAGAPELEVLDLGVREYDACLSLQHAIVQQRLAGESPDRLLLVGHPSVITVGKSGAALDVLVPAAELAKRRIGLAVTDRGGKTTWHGPGQLVAYPVLKLESRDVHAYVRDLLQVVCAVLGDYGLEGELRPGSPGVWVQGRKIASIGVSVRRWVTYHGIALNVCPDLSEFALIVPCGARGAAITSLERELRRPVALDEVKRRFTGHFARIFGMRARERADRFLHAAHPPAGSEGSDVGLAP